MIQELISVIMPVYNAERYVVEAIESILNQTYGHFELIIIDDCSTDRSLEIINLFAAQDERVIVLENKINLKQALTRNIAISKASGKYIAFMDADDISFPNRLEEQINFMENNPEIDICGTWLYVFSDNNKNRTYKITPYSNHNEIMINMMFNKNIMSHSTVMMKSCIFTQDGIWYDKDFAGNAEDYHLWDVCLKHGLIFYNMPKFLLWYRTSALQTSVAYRGKILETVSFIISNNIYTYFKGFLDKKILESYVKYKVIPKENLSICQLLNYQRLMKQIIKCNTEHNIFNQEIFKKAINDDSMVRSLLRRLKKVLYTIGYIVPYKN